MRHFAFAGGSALGFAIEYICSGSYDRYEYLSYFTIGLIIGIIPMSYIDYIRNNKK